MKPLILALDVDSKKEVVELLHSTKNSVDVYKVGPTLILKYGPEIFRLIRRARKQIFLDLKFHDIPNTMLRSILESGKNGIYSATVHASAGPVALRMISTARARPKIWGVTVLTSFSESDFKIVGFKRPIKKQVLHFAELAKKSGLDGLVASVQETSSLRKKLGRAFTIVTPGIRLPGDDTGDQKRIATPRLAREMGSTFIVVGRPILEARDPGLAAKRILEDWHG